MPRTGYWPSTVWTYWYEAPPVPVSATLLTAFHPRHFALGVSVEKRRYIKNGQAVTTEAGNDAFCGAEGWFYRLSHVNLGLHECWLMKRPPAPKTVHEISTLEQTT